MHAYRVIHTGAIVSLRSYFATLALAHEDAKEYGPQQFDEMRIELVQVDDSKAGVLALLNGDEPEEKDVLRTWRLGPRGGLVECPNGE